MKTQFALDLRLARRKAGLTQADGAHLAEIRRTKLSALECGRTSPNLREIITLSILYGRSFESFFAAEMEKARRLLLKQLKCLPDNGRSTVGTLNRSNTLDRLRHRLEAEIEDHDA